MVRHEIGIDQTVVGWRAWYTGGRQFDSGSTLWEELPAVGVLYIVLYNRTRPYRRMMSSVTLYWKDGDMYCCDNTADARIREELPRNCIKEGRWTTDQEYMDTYIAASDTWDAPDESLRVDRP